MVPEPGYVGGDLPYLAVIARVLQDLNSGSIEVDLLEAFQGGGLPQRRTYTASATLNYYDTMKDIVYDSSSAGTLTLPAAVEQHHGARVFFTQAGTGLLTIGDPATGTLVSAPNMTGNRALLGRYARAVAVCDGLAATWNLVGQLG